MLDSSPKAAGKSRGLFKVVEFIIAATVTRE